MNRAGLDFYARLVDACSRTASSPASRSITGICRRRSTTAAAGSIPTSPAGSPTTRASCSARSATACRCGRRSTSRGWSTDGGYLHGVHAPGHRNLFEAPLAAHHLLRAHGAAVRGVPRATARRRRSGSSSTSSPRTRRRDAPEDRGRDGARRRLHEPAVPRPALSSAATPRSCAEIYGEAWPKLPGRGLRADSRSRSTSSASTTTRAASTRHDPASRRCARATRATAAAPLYTETGWEVHPESLHAMLCSGCASATATCRSTSPRTAPRSTIRPRRRRPRRRSAARRLPARPPARRARGHRGRRRRARLLRLVAARQPRVGARATPSASASCTSTSRRSAHAQGERASSTAT